MSETKDSGEVSIASIDWLCAELEKMNKRLTKRKIHYLQMTTFNEAACEGYNEGLKDATSDISRTIARIKKAHNVTGEPEWN